MRAVLFVGDDWLERVFKIMVSAFPSENFIFLSESEINDISNYDLVVSSHGIKFDFGRVQKITCPTIFLDGLTSLEIFHGTLLGSEYLPENIGVGGINRLVRSLASGSADFHLQKRFQRSLKYLHDQEETTLRISDFISEWVYEVPIFHGAGRPNPVVTQELAIRIAKEMSLSERSIFDLNHWERDIVSYRRATRVTLPWDAERFGFRYEVDRYWYFNLDRIIKSSYDDDGILKQSLRTDFPRLITDELSRAVAFRAASSTKLRGLNSALKEKDNQEIVTEVESLIRNIEDLNDDEKGVLIGACLQWYPSVGKRERSLSVALDNAAVLAARPHLLTKFVNVSNLSETISTIEASLSVLDNLPVDHSAMKEKLLNRKKMLERKQSRLQE